MYRLIDDVLLSNDLHFSAISLIRFADAVQYDKNKATVLKHFYERMGYLVNDYAYQTLLDSDNPYFYVSDGSKVVRMFVALLLPSRTTTGKTLAAIRDYGKRLCDKFHEPVGEGFTKSSLLEGLTYLRDNKVFFRKVFPKGRVAFYILPYSHIKYNSYYYTSEPGSNSNSGVFHNFFLFGRNSNSSAYMNPVNTLVYEFAKALNARLSGDINVPFCKLVEMLGINRYKNISAMPVDKQLEVCLNVITKGLIYNTPYEKYDKLFPTSKEDSELFKVVGDRLISYL